MTATPSTDTGGTWVDEALAREAAGQTRLWPHGSLLEWPTTSAVGSRDAETAHPSRRGPARRVVSRVVEEDVKLESLSVPLIEELGRILGEALVQQYQRDTADMGVTRSGSNHGGGGPSGPEEGS